MQNWSGCFSSKHYGPAFVNGKFNLKLDLEKDDYETDFICTYLGTFRQGMNIEGRVRVKGDVFNITLIGNQIIVFEIENKTNDLITGDYTSRSPGDVGTFKLIPGDVHPEIDQYSGSYCQLI